LDYADHKSAGKQVINQLLRIEPLLGKNAVYAGKNALPKARR
jgi:hypothetical protein